MQMRCSELEELRARLESRIRSAEQRCAATQTTADGLQQANVHLRQQLSSSQAEISEQVIIPLCLCIQQLSHLSIILPTCQFASSSHLWGQEPLKIPWSAGSASFYVLREYNDLCANNAAGQ